MALNAKSIPPGMVFSPSASKFSITLLNTFFQLSLLERRRGVSRLASVLNWIRQSLSLYLRYFESPSKAFWRSLIFSPIMLPLTSTTHMRSIGSRFSNCFCVSSSVLMFMETGIVCEFFDERCTTLYFPFAVIFKFSLRS